MKRTKEPTIKDLSQANPSIFDAEKEKVDTAINVLLAEASEVENEWMREELEAVAEFLENEVKH